ncbi:hypothetical protein CU254_42355 (plasmid) [Amycolatopsis sp. AA4]|uniref:outer membrane protein assembly factor BamB family protein n=1 Tax=Actinomycetes TaxID=1760 RepID=UPI0001B57688|nr:MULTISPECIES: PQQ-binding-like beta-propeller repeat protein [Actinomycetes]ATY17232.1 hypothetical protein CU254_42355 [Amycolatopsis sp. AA4]EFL12710.1 hypothetical protein SSMG_08381 [Streptomyces sp. AA4]
MGPTRESGPSRRGTAPGGAGFDPATVPVYPVVRIRLEAEPGAVDGTVRGLVDGAVVAVSGDLAEVRAQLIREVARKAALRPGRAIRAKGEDLSGAVWETVVTDDGQTYDATALRSPRKTRRPRRAVLIAAAGVALTLAVALVAAVLILQRPAPSESAAPALPEPVATELPVAGPAGWSRVATWSAPVEANSPNPASQVAADELRVFAPGKSSVVAYSAATGARLWSAGLGGTVQTGPALTRIGGAPAVVAASSSEIQAWDPATGRSLLTAKLPSSSARVRVTPTGPMVTDDNGGQHVLVVQGQDLVARVLPSGATPLFPTADGALVAAAAPGQLWRITSDAVAGDPIPVAAPAGATFSSVAGATERAIVLAYAPPGAASGTVVLRAFPVAGGEPLWTSTPVPQAQVAAGTTSALAPAAPSGHWGIYGTSIVDLDLGKTTSLPTGWQTSVVGDAAAFGTVDGTAVAATPAGLTAASTQALAAGRTGGTSVPGAPGAVRGTTAYLVARDGNAEHLYAVPAADAAPASAGGR